MTFELLFSSYKSLPIFEDTDLFGLYASPLIFDYLFVNISISIVYLFKYKKKN